MSADKDVDHALQQTTSSISFHAHNPEPDYSSKMPQNIKNYSHSAAIETVNSMNRELQTLYEKYLELGVRSHLLEVDLATQFSPDLVLAVEELNENCRACCHAVEELVQYSQNAKSLSETSLNDNEQDNVMATCKNED